MQMEHFALNVENVSETVKWFVEHLGMVIVREDHNAEQMHFLGDTSGSTLIEFYCNRAAPILNYAAMDPLELHIAFTVDDIEAERDRLLAAGATLAEDLKQSPLGDRLVMLREPGGIAIQLVKRVKAMR